MSVQMAEIAKPVAVQANPMTTLTVTVPEGVKPGQMLTVQHAGMNVQVAVPAGVVAGQQISVQVPAAAVPIQAQAQLQQVNAFDKLMSLKGVWVKQKIELLEIMTGFETQNKYKCYGYDPDTHSKTMDLFKAKEDSECCERQYCGARRTFRMNIFNKPSEDLAMAFDRPFACECFCGCRSLLTVRLPNEEPIAEIFHPFSCCNTILEVRAPAGGELWYTINSGCFCSQPGFFCKCPCEACMTISFPIYDPKGERVGSVDRHWAGCGKAMFTDADNFAVIFPEAANAHQRAALFASIFLIDFLHFEEKASNNNRGGYY